MARVETQIPKIIILGVFLNVLLATALSTNRFVSKRSSHDQLDHQTERASKTHNSSDDSTEAYNRTTRSLDLGLSRDTFHGLPPILSGPLVTTGLLTAPVTQASSISDSFGQGLSVFPGFGANMTISVPTTTSSIQTATKSDSEYIPHPTSAPSSGSQSFMSSEVFAQSTVVVTVNAPESSPTPVETPPELITSTQIVWATAPPTVSTPTSPSTGSNTNMSSNSNSLMISSNYLMFICSFTTVLSYIVSFR